MKGRIHSIETLGGLDGPGMRCVVFLQGCPLRCLYCHNPDTHAVGGGTLMTSADVMQRVRRFRPYFGDDGGVTLSGGEPLMQAAFAAELMAMCRSEGIHTALDTSGAGDLDEASAVLEHTSLAIVDLKHACPRRHERLTGGRLETTLAFLRLVGRLAVPLWVRQVIVPGWNDSDSDVQALVSLLADLRLGPGLLKRVELLPYHSMAQTKWAALGRDYPLAGVPDADPARVADMQRLVDSAVKLFRQGLYEGR